MGMFFEKPANRLPLSGDQLQVAFQAFLDPHDHREVMNAGTE
jgi:hypothetical protein